MFIACAALLLEGQDPDIAMLPFFLSHEDTPIPVQAALAGDLGYILFRLGHSCTKVVCLLNAIAHLLWRRTETC
jgi:hypothetical protein